MLAVPQLQETAATMRWLEPGAPSEQAQALASALGAPDWLTQILVARGIHNLSDAQSYLAPDCSQMHSPLLMRGMQEAVSRILLAVSRRESILIYGDYDVDGTTATVLLKTAIDRITPAGVGSLVRYHIPHRIREGYGMQASVLAAAAEENVRLVISVDTGVRAFAAADEARNLGLDLIVTDHHLPDGTAGVPDAVAIINPNQAGCSYPCKDLCGAAVAFKLAEALLTAATTAPAEPHAYRQVDSTSLHEKLLPSLLKLVAIATVADAVPLCGENRVIAALGLRALADPRQHGLRALMELAKVSLESVAGPTATEVAFRIAPRINAAGRMDVASDVVQMLLTREPAEARALAQKLHDLNEERRAVERGALEALNTEMIALEQDATALQKAGCVVLDGDGWHRGVIGILASRVVERMGRPALVITHEDGQAHGSGRSVAGFHLLDALTAAHGDNSEGLFSRFGGHAHAVGFTLPSASLPLLRSRLADYAPSRLPDKLLERRLHLDACLSLEELGDRAPQHLARLAPFGHGNREPCFMTLGLTVVEEPRILKDRHIKLRLRSHTGAVITGLGWSRSVPWPQRLATLGVVQGTTIDVAYRLRVNTDARFGGTEMELCDLRLSATSQQL